MLLKIYNRNLLMLQIILFVYDMPFQPSLMFVGKAWVYPRLEPLKGPSLG
jgi:hypothetical protein